MCILPRGARQPPRQAAVRLYKRRTRFSGVRRLQCLTEQHPVSERWLVPHSCWERNASRLDSALGAGIPFAPHLTWQQSAARGVCLSLGTWSPCSLLGVWYDEQGGIAMLRTEGRDTEVSPENPQAANFRTLLCHS